MLTRTMVRGEVMPVPEGQITGSQIWQSPIEPVEEELIDHEKCPCFYGGGCPTDGRHLPE